MHFTCFLLIATLFVLFKYCYMSLIRFGNLVSIFARFFVLYIFLDHPHGREFFGVLYPLNTRLRLKGNQLKKMHSKVFQIICFFFELESSKVLELVSVLRNYQINFGKFH